MQSDSCLQTTDLFPGCRDSVGEGRRFPGSRLELHPQGLCFDLFLDERAHAFQDHKSGSSAQTGASSRTEVLPND